MITLEPLHLTRASLTRLIEAIDEQTAPFGRAIGAEELLIQIQMIARMDVMKAVVAVQADEALGVVAIKNMPDEGASNISLMYATPDADAAVGIALVDYALQVAWEDPAVQVMTAQLFTDPPGVINAFAAHGVEVIPRQMMRLSGIQGKEWHSPLAPGYSFALWERSQLDEITHFVVASNRGTSEERLMPGMDQFEGMRDIFRDVLHGKWGPVDYQASSLVVDTAGTMVGMILISLTPDHVGFVIDVNVDRAHRRRGIARAMMNRAIEILAAHGAEEVQLGVTTANPARLLYEDLGFVLVAPVWAYYANRPAASTNLHKF